jgi:ribosome-binding factor A
MRRSEQVNETLAHHAAQFFARESNHESLITVTRSDMSSDFKNVTVYISVLPESQEEKALAFAKRVRTDFREYLKQHTVMHPIPTVDFVLDLGEKNRQRVDELTRK